MEIVLVCHGESHNSYCTLYSATTSVESYSTSTLPVVAQYVCTCTLYSTYSTYICECFLHDWQSYFMYSMYRVYINNFLYTVFVYENDISFSLHSRSWTSTNLSKSHIQITHQQKCQEEPCVLIPTTRKRTESEKNGGRQDSADESKQTKPESPG